MNGPFSLQNKLVEIFEGDFSEELEHLLDTREPGLDLQYRDEDGRNLLFIAIGAWAFDCVETLIKKGARVNETVPVSAAFKEKNALCLALALGKFNLAERLLEAGADVRARTHDGRSCIAVVVKGTPLGAAEEDSEEQERRAEMIDKLCDLGCDVNQRDSQGHTPLMLSTMMVTSQGYAPRVVEALLRNGADPNLDGPKGGKVLHLAWREAGLPLVRMLVSHGADVNARDWAGKTPLFYVGSPKVFDEFAALGADPHLIDHDGQTVLHDLLSKQPLSEWVAQRASHLLQLGIDPHLRDYSGRSSLDALNEQKGAAVPFADCVRGAIAAKDAREAMKTAASLSALRPV